VRAPLLRHGLQRCRAFLALGGWSTDVVLTPPTWQVRAARWLSALGVLIVVYQLYAILVVPLIEPTSRRPDTSYEPVPKLARDVHPDLTALFPEGAWERDRPMVLATQWGKLLFREYRPGADGRLELVPCTIVFYAPSRGAGPSAAPRAIVLQAPDKAVLNFAGPLNLLRAEFTKLLSARLEGEVRIWSHETRPGAKDAIDIATRNVQILPRQIWTAHDVTFRYGATHGSGRDLSISLQPSGETDSPQNSDPLVRDLALLELAHLDKLVVQLPARRLFATAHPATSPPSDEPPAGGGPPELEEVSITCNGPLRFDFRAARASLEDHVDIVRGTPDGQSDQLNCDQLLLYLDASPDVVASPSVPAAAERTGADVPAARRGLAVRRVEASGFPVTLRAPSLAAQARGQQLSYDFQTRRLILADEQMAVLDYRTHHAEAPRLEYELHADPQRLGRLWAAGPGSYQGQLGDDPADTLRAQWVGKLELQPQDDLHVLSITQGADLTWQNATHFAANELYVWLSETRSTPTPVAASEPADPPAGDAPRPPEEPRPPEPGAPSGTPSPAASSPAPRPRIRPVKMLALGSVRADAAAFQGQTQRLEIWFDQLQELLPKDAPPPDEPAADAKAADAKAADAKAADAKAADADRSADARHTPPQQRLELQGDWVRLRLLMRPASPQVREATVVGQVQLAQRAAGAVPLLITGEMLQLRTDVRARATVDVNGAPARVQVQGLLLEGASLHLSQQENRLWAEGPGRVKLPMPERSPAASPPSPAGASPRTPIWVSWQGGMDFDGQLIRFLQQVEVRGAGTAANGDRARVTAIGDQLQAVLNRYVVLEKSPPSNSLEVSELRFLGQVFTEILTFNTQDVMVSRDRLQMRDMQLDRRTGLFQAGGPGWITSTRYGPASGLPLAGAAAAPAATDPAAPPGSLVFVRVDFQNGVRGNVDRREAVFEHLVRTVYGPVQSWDDTLNADRRETLGPQSIVITCQRLLVTETGAGTQRGVELSAVGNTLVEGERFTAKAQRLTYVQAKDQLVLDGDDGLAQLQQQQRAGQRPTEFSARQIKYWVGTGQVEVFGATQLDYTHVGAPDMPSARIR
jgi:lipopolysaccharide export system protein LptA